MIDLVLRKGARRADREQFGRDSDKARKQKLLTIELRSETRHRMKQTAREFFARPGRIIDVLLQIAMEIVDLARAG